MHAMNAWISDSSGCTGLSGVVAPTGVSPPGGQRVHGRTRRDPLCPVKSEVGEAYETPRQEAQRIGRQQRHLKHSALLELRVHLNIWRTRSFATLGCRDAQRRLRLSAELRYYPAGCHCASVVAPEVAACRASIVCVGFWGVWRAKDGGVREDLRLEPSSFSDGACLRRFCYHHGAGDAHLGWTSAPNAGPSGLVVDRAGDMCMRRVVCPCAWLVVAARGPCAAPRLPSPLWEFGS